MDDTNKIVIASGYFDPLHIGHIRYLKEARTMGSELWVIVNNDDQAILKKGKPFMRDIERARIVAELRFVEKCGIAFDIDATVKKSIEFLALEAFDQGATVIFAKGGDSKPENTPEEKMCQDMGILTAYGVGGGKIQSSSWLTNGSSQ